MQSLVFLFIAHALFRYPGDNVWAATVISCFLALCMWAVARFGGWSSLKSALAWLRSHPVFAFLLAGQSVMLALVGAIDPSAFQLNHLLAYLIEGFFFSYAFFSGLLALWSAGTASITSWLRRP